ncbi:hypothetical protein [Saccharothrix syringae]|uniref:Uncharacterized protein n=1 Tax=Saccharothrix syringae TaxID=103733 RepID=A0A5Q0GXC1_SACSY|nr:hypothetical protein [Saccharothrix syringae]QFZ18533.1 hypothetical protein EKG83_14615 [Saccharothrix syringae]
MSTTPTPDTGRVKKLFEENDARRTLEHAAWLADAFAHLTSTQSADRVASLLEKIASDSAADPRHRLAAVRATDHDRTEHRLIVDLLSTIITDPAVPPSGREAAAAALAVFDPVASAAARGAAILEGADRTSNVPPTWFLSALVPQDDDTADAYRRKAEAALDQARAELTAALLKQPSRHAADDWAPATETDTTAMTALVDLLVDFELSSLGTPLARTARRRTPPATVGRILARSQGKTDTADTDRPTSRLADDLALVAELKHLARGRGLQDPHRQVGPMLSRLAGLRPGDNTASDTRKLAHLLTSVLDHLPHNLATTFATIVNLRTDLGHETMPQRIDLLAKLSGVNRRLILRRWDRAARLAAELLLPYPQTTLPDKPDTEPAAARPRPPRRANETRRSGTTG